MDTTALDQMSDVIAHAVLQLAMTASSVDGIERASETGSRFIR